MCPGAEREAGRSSRRRGRRLRELLSFVAEKADGLDLMNRSLLFAALGFLSFVPLMMVVAAADPGRAAGLGRWLARAMSASEPAEREILALFARPRRILREVTGFGLAALCVFGLAFAAHVRQTYEAVWGTPGPHVDGVRAALRELIRHVLWLVLLIGCLLLLGATPLSRTGLLPGPLGVVAVLIVVLAFVWASQAVLLGGRPGGRALLSGAIATTLGLVGLRLFAWLVFSPLIISQMTVYGPIGAVVIILSWLVGVGFVLYGGAFVGRLTRERWASRPRGG
ncbi:YhjD/YihY/BrkB family envelope integrity protein [Streptomyces sp. CC208A]|uniref:YhjD/YihY/BrkB family envelope integrity protein n=1 Tax=Streptomyces sp. CC208A TaxID=3044573 RepID=UPI0024A7ECA4|nr:YhjD/YihY/BrkB family envelope integrity protein [Streptomyces sp. CC208A]